MKVQISGGGQATVQGGSDFSETYSKMSDDELLRVASQKDSLLPLAQEALTTEMQKRGMDEDAVVSYRLREDEVDRQESQRATFEKKVRAKNRFATLLYLAILFGGVVLADWAMSQVFGLPAEATRILTKISLDCALAIAVLSRAFPRRWLTVKTTLIATALLSLGLAFWVSLSLH